MEYVIETPTVGVPLVAYSLPKAMAFAAAFVEAGQPVTITPREKKKGKS